jgi:hypothetical protein
MRKDDYSKGRVCECGASVCNKSKSGLCRPCFMVRLNGDPNKGAKIGAAVREWLKDPANKARHTAGSRRAAITKRNDPELKARLAKIMREKVQPISIATGANVRGRDYCAMSKLAVEARMAWCPPEYRDQYRAITAKGIVAQEARRIIAAQIKADIAALSPFERQMRALEKGAALIANDQRPSLASPGYYEERKAG